MYRDFEYYRPIKLGEGCYFVKPTSYLACKFLKLIDLIIVKLLGLSILFSYFTFYNISLDNYFFAYKHDFLAISLSILFSWHNFNLR